MQLLKRNYLLCVKEGASYQPISMPIGMRKAIKKCRRGFGELNLITGL